MSDYKDGEWTVDTWGGEFSPMALGPENVSLDVAADTIRIEHETPSDYWPTDMMTSVTVPRAWLMAAIAAFDAHRNRSGA